MSSRYFREVLSLFHSRRDTESSTNTAARAATQESTPGSSSAEAHDFRAAEQHRWRSAPDEIASIIKHRQQRERLLPRQPDPDCRADERCSSRREISLFSWKLVAKFPRRRSWKGDIKLHNFKHFQMNFIEIGIRQFILIHFILFAALFAAGCPLQVRPQQLAFAHLRKGRKKVDQFAIGGEHCLPQIFARPAYKHATKSVSFATRIDQLVETAGTSSNR